MRLCNELLESLSDQLEEVFAPTANVTVEVNTVRAPAVCQVFVRTSSHATSHVAKAHSIHS